MSEQKVFRFVVPHQPQANGCFVCSSYVLIWVLGCTLGSSSNTTLQIFSANSAHWVGFFNIGSGWVLEKIPGSGSGSGRVGVLKYTIWYFWVSFLLLGSCGYFREFQGILDIICVLEVVSQILGFHVWEYPKYRVIFWVIPDNSGYPLPDDFQNRIRSGWE